MDITNLKEQFNKIFGEGESIDFFSPVIVNIMGEHLVYNEGSMLATTTDLGFYGVARKRSDNIVNVSYEEKIKFSIDLENNKTKIEDNIQKIFTDSVEIIKTKEFNLAGIDVLISGNIPYKDTLSLNSSMQMLIGTIVNSLFNEGKISKLQLAKMFTDSIETKNLEGNYKEINNLAVLMGEKKKAILVEGHNLEHKQVALDLGDYTIVVMDTNKESMNIDEVLVDRKKQVVEATEVLKNYKNINYLWEFNEEAFEKLEFKIEEELLRKRAKHIITENERVKKALRAIKTGNIKELGTLMVISHNSLERWYEVTGVELDTIVDEALRAEGCIGAKMIGDGFGGYAIALVNKNYLNKFFNRVKEKYTAKIGYEPNFYL